MVRRESLGSIPDRGHYSGLAVNHPVSEHSQVQTGEDKETNPRGDETTAASHLGADWLQKSVWEGYPFFLTGENWRTEFR